MAPPGPHHLGGERTNLPRLEERLRGRSDRIQVTPFGNTLHVVSTDAPVLEAAIAPPLQRRPTSMTMVMMTGLAMTRERERGTFKISGDGVSLCNRGRLREIVPTRRTFFLGAPWSKLPSVTRARGIGPRG